MMSDLNLAFLEMLSISRHARYFRQPLTFLFNLSFFFSLFFYLLLVYTGSSQDSLLRGHKDDKYAWDIVEVLATGNPLYLLVKAV